MQQPTKLELVINLKTEGARSYWLRAQAYPARPISMVVSFPARDHWARRGGGHAL